MRRNYDYPHYRSRGENKLINCPVKQQVSEPELKRRLKKLKKFTYSISIYCKTISTMNCDRHCMMQNYTQCKCGTCIKGDYKLEGKKKKEKKTYANI